MEIHERASLLCDRGHLHEAMALLEEGVGTGDGAAAHLLANWRFEGRLIRRDFDEALRLFRIAHKLAYRDADLPLMALLATGAGPLTRDWHGSLELLRVRSQRDAVSLRHLKLIEAMAIDPSGNPSLDFAPNFVSTDPLIVRFENFLTRDECDQLIALADASLAPSLVVHPQTGELVRDKIRNSSAAAFPLLQEGPFLHAINRRIAAASRSQWEQGEPTQILHYTAGQEYKLHSDALNSGNQRIQTFLIYLTDDFDGGETYFPHGEHRLRLPKGDAVCFSNVSNDMRPAKNAFHAGLPVTRGQKIVLSKWIRQHTLDLKGPPDKPF